MQFHVNRQAPHNWLSCQLPVQLSGSAGCNTLLQVRSGHEALHREQGEQSRRH